MYKTIKRIFDIIGALILLTLTLPLSFVVILATIYQNKGTPFFVQKRPGKDGIIFNLLKFKTMNDKTDDRGKLLPDYQRLTRIGSFVRSLSIDELPQLINVVKGDMSLIGPRPLLIRYLPLYDEFQKKRHNVRPGITGWAQINGRNAIGWNEKFKFDVWYVENLSFMLDLKIVFLSVKKIIGREGISASEKVTMPFFNGSSEENK